MGKKKRAKTDAPAATTAPPAPDVAEAPPETAATGAVVTPPAEGTPVTIGAAAEPEPPKRKRDIIRRFKDTLTVKLTDHELADISGKASTTWDAVVAAEKDLAEKSKELRTAVKAAKLAHAKVMEQISTGSGTAEVECIDVLDWDRKLVFTERLDLDEDHDGRIITRRAMTEEERQFPLKLEGDAPADPVPDQGQTLSALAKVAELAKDTKPTVRWHRDGKVCGKAEGSCRRPHVTDAEILRRAGVEPAAPPVEETKAPEPEPPAPEGETIAPPSDTRDEPAESTFRGQHEDRSVCYDDDCTQPHAMPRSVSSSTPPAEDWRGRHPKEEYRGRHTELDGAADGNCYVAACARLHTTGVPPNEDAPDITSEVPNGEA
jgi:hypothetical protein